MVNEKVGSWDQRSWTGGKKNEQEIEHNTLQVLEQIFEKEWVPNNGIALEIGCGTAPILRWVCQKGFKGHGIDVSKTAIDIAKSKSTRYEISLEQADFCQLNDHKEQYDLIIDGHCFHCLTNQKDREQFLNLSLRLLRPEGVFILMTMCSPINYEILSGKLPDQLLKNGILYAPMPLANEYKDAIEIDGMGYVPTRRIEHWLTILREIWEVGFNFKYVVYDAFSSDNPFGSFFVVCTHKSLRNTSQEEGKYLTNGDFASHFTT